MDEAVALLLKRARRTLEEASYLQAGGFAEGATVRAYYAMLHAAEAALLQEGLVFSSHRAVLGAFGRELAGRGLLDRTLHRHLLDAFERRQRADYDQHTDVTSAQAAEQVRQAEEFLAAVESFLRQRSDSGDPGGE